jgi:hypothetical protein
MTEESPALGQYDYVTDGFEKLNPYQKEVSINPYQKEVSKHPTNDSGRRRKEFNENDTTAEFQSPLRGVKQNSYNDVNAPPTVPRYANVGGSGGKYQPQSHQPKRYSASVGGRLNLSEIPIVDSGSDRSSPNASSPSDQDKESPQGERLSYG